MNVLSPRIHGVLDYVIVVFFLLAPTLFDLPYGPSTLAYVLAVAYLTMTVLTDFPLGMVEVISFGVHGVVELVFAIALVVLPWILSDMFRDAQGFYTAVGVVLFLLWLSSDYSATPASTKTSPKPDA